ncbi:MAG: hypothetical protein K8R88_13205 [Armatimonadetes bacterium]|nr:hypothetical protein [Armatimonadota bacterium]
MTAPPLPVHILGRNFLLRNRSDNARELTSLHEQPLSLAARIRADLLTLVNLHWFPMGEYEVTTQSHPFEESLLFSWVRGKRKNDFTMITLKGMLRPALVVLYPNCPAAIEAVLDPGLICVRKGLYRGSQTVFSNFGQPLVSLVGLEDEPIAGAKHAFVAWTADTFLIEQGLVGLLATAILD